VSTNQTAPLTAEAAPTNSSPIENELPTYRAISTRAILSVICGALAAFSFAELWFLVFAALAIVLGVMANLAIKRRPDLLTGRRFANTGIALGLVFGLVVITYTTVMGIIISREASKFADVYAKVLKEGSFGDALLYRLDPESRKDKTAAAMEQEYQAQKARERGLAEQKMMSVLNIRKALQAKDTHLHLVAIENQGIDEERVDRVGFYAAALFELEGYDPKVHIQGGEYALALLKGSSKGRHYEWYVDNLVYPYKPRSYKAAPKPVDDGHGHGPGGH
jgi:hypothetical protein